MARCFNCPRKDQPCVPSFGPPDAEIAFIGERPGRQEIKIGRPFVGPSGQFLDQTIESVCDRLQVPVPKIWKGNVCNCFDPKNKAPKASEINACWSRLLDELAGLKPHLKMVVALGSIPAKVLLDVRKGVTWARGRIMQYPNLDCDFGFTYHPAAMLRPGGNELFQDFEFDLTRYIKHLHDGGEPDDEVEQNYYWAHTEEEALALIELCRGAKVFSVDLETDSAGVIDFQNDRVLQVNVGWAPGQAGVIRYPLFTDNVLAELKELFTNPEYFRILHSGKFDSKFSGKLTGEPIQVDFDTMLAHLMFDERRGTHALYQVAPRYTGLDTYEHLIQPYLPSKETSFANIPSDKLALYGCRDADCELRLGLVFKKDLVGQPFEDLYYQMILPASNAFTYAERSGIMIDVPYAEKLQAQLQVRINEAQHKLTLGGKINLRSPKQLAVHLYDELGIGEVEGMGRTTKEKALQKMNHPYAKELLNFREADKLHGTYLKKLIAKAKEDSGHLVYMDYQLHGTVTGRFSERGARIMTIPRESYFRNIFHARPGFEFLGLDYSGAEVRWIAVYSGDPDLTAIVNSGRDIHTEVACGMFKHTREQFEALPKDRRTLLRIYSKSVVFGLLYGRGPRSLAEQLGVTADEARGYIQRFFSQFPGVRDWMGKTQWEAVRKRELQTAWGRKRRFGLIDQENRHIVHRQAVNFLPSSSSSDMTLCTYVRVFNEFGYAGPVFLHDGCLWELPEGMARDIVPRVREIAESSPLLVVETPVTFPVELSIGVKWGSLKEVT